MENEEYYSTSDLGLSTLLSVYYPVEKTDRVNPKRMVFYFKKDKNIDKMVDDYWSKKLKVEPQSYFMQIKLIKNMIYGQIKR